MVAFGYIAAGLSAIPLAFFIVALATDVSAFSYHLPVFRSGYVCMCARGDALQFNSNAPWRRTGSPGQFQNFMLDCCYYFYFIFSSELKT